MSNDVSMGGSSSDRTHAELPTGTGVPQGPSGTAGPSAAPTGAANAGADAGGGEGTGADAGEGTGASGPDYSAVEDAFRKIIEILSGIHLDSTKQVMDLGSLIQNQTATTSAVSDTNAILENLQVTVREETRALSFHVQEGFQNMTSALRENVTATHEARKASNELRQSMQDLSKKMASFTS